MKQLSNRIKPASIYLNIGPRTYTVFINEQNSFYIVLVVSFKMSLHDKLWNNLNENTNSLDIEKISYQLSISVQDIHTFATKVNTYIFFFFFQEKKNYSLQHARSIGFVTFHIFMSCQIA